MSSDSGPPFPCTTASGSHRIGESVNVSTAHARLLNLSILETIFARLDEYAAVKETDSTKGKDAKISDEARFNNIFLNRIQAVLDDRSAIMKRRQGMGVKWTESLRLSQVLDGRLVMWLSQIKEDVEKRPSNFDMDEKDELINVMKKGFLPSLDHLFEYDLDLQTVIGRYKPTDEWIHDLTARLGTCVNLDVRRCQFLERYKELSITHYDKLKRDLMDSSLALLGLLF